MTLDVLDQEFASALPGRGAPSLAALVQRLFVAEDAPAPAPTLAATRPVEAQGGLTVERYTSITQIDKALWDSLLGTVGFISWDSLVMQEQVFSGATEPENSWEFLYVIVRDAAGGVVAAALFTVALCKDDMLMREEVSFRVEERRRLDPYFLSSRALLLGSLLSEGNHLYLDRAGPWRAALGRLLSVAREELDRAGCTVMVLRDLPAEDAEMDQEMLHHGLVKVPTLDTHLLPITWQTEQGYLDHLKTSKRKRQALIERIAQSHRYERRLHGAGVGEPLSPGELDHLHGLYTAVARKALRLNVFHLPARLLAAMQTSPAWEIVTLRLDPAHGGPADGRPVAFYAAHKQGGHYGGFLCGVDYDYVYTHGAYRQMLYQTVRRAMELGMTTLHLGMTADMEKLRFGTVARRRSVYLQARDHFDGALLREIAAEASLAGKPARAPAPVAAE